MRWCVSDARGADPVKNDHRPVACPSENSLKTGLFCLGEGLHKYKQGVRRARAKNRDKQTVTVTSRECTNQATTSCTGSHRSQGPEFCTPALF